MQVKHKGQQAKFSGEQAEQVKELKEHPGWKIYLMELDEARLSSAREALLMPAEDYKIGFYHGLERARSIVDWIITDAIENPTQRVANLPKEQLNELPSW
jgi:hypothetical protein